MTQDNIPDNSPGGADARPERWNSPQPKVLAKPTYWPLVLAVGITLLAWGVVTAYPISALGLVMSAIAIFNWIGDIRREQQSEIERD